MAKKILFPVVAVVGIALASAAAWWYQNKSVATGPGASAGNAGAVTSAKPPAVNVAPVVVMKLIDEAQAVGSLRSRQSVVLRPEVSGRISQLNFRDGQQVRQGQLLVQLDDQLPLAQVQQSRAELSIAMANHTRNKELVAQNFISQRSVDESAANVAVAQAKLALAQATAARLKILAPFDGIAGIRTVNVGDYLKDGADIVNIEDIEAVLVDFRLPDRFQHKLKKGQIANLDLDAWPGASFVATILAIDPLIDANGRSVGVRGCIDNRQLQLRPGMFARVRAVFGEREKAKVVPEEAIVPLGGKTYLIRLRPGAKASTQVSERVEVKLGIRRPGRVEILEGVQEGDIVVTAGHQRIGRDGTEVTVMPTPGAPDAPASAPQAAASKVTTPLAKKASENQRGGGNPCLERKH